MKIYRLFINYGYEYIRAPSPIIKTGLICKLKASAMHLIPVVLGLNSRNVTVNRHASSLGQTRLSGGTKGPQAVSTILMYQLSIICELLMVNIMPKLSIDIKRRYKVPLA